jgi:hypothetical protein
MFEEDERGRILPRSKISLPLPTNKKPLITDQATRKVTKKFVENFYHSTIKAKKKKRICLLLDCEFCKFRIKLAGTKAMRVEGVRMVVGVVWWRSGEIVVAVVAYGVDYIGGDGHYCYY